MNAEQYQQSGEEQASWRQHRREEANLAEAQWLAHAARWTGYRASSDSQRVQDGLVCSGALARLQDRPTLRLGSWPATRRDWDASEVCE